MKKIRFLLITLLTALLISGCSSGGNPTTEDISAKTSLYNDESTIVKLMDELKKRPELKGKDLKIFPPLYLYENKVLDRYAYSLKIYLLKPDTFNDVVVYEYATSEGKKWTDPQPVKIVGGSDITSNLVSFNDVSFKNVPAICKQTREKTAELKDVEINVVMLRLSEEDLHPYWSVQFTGKKGDSTIRGDVDFDLQGNMQNYDQYVQGDKT